MTRLPRCASSACALALAAALLAAPRPAAAEEVVKVGALLSVTGPAAFLGGPEARTLELLVEQANAKGGWGGRRIQLLLKDTGGSPEKAISFAKQLLEEEQVVAIIGPSTSGESMQVKPLAEAAKTPLLSCAAAEAIVNPVARYVFKTAQKDSHAALQIFQQLKKMGLSKIALLTSNTGFGKAGKEQIEKTAPENGIQVVASEVYDKAATDLTAEVTKIKAAGPQAILNWSIEPAQSIVIKNARQLGLTIPIFQSHGFANIQYAKAAGAAAEGVIFPASKIVVAEALSDKDPQKGILLAYKKEYEARFKEDVSAFGGYAWDAFAILGKAVAAAGTDRAKVRDAIEGTKGLVATTGLFTMGPADHNGLDASSFVLLTVKNGQFAFQGK
jgi:branched-chain amino acid transport system substrate-binding protein